MKKALALILLVLPVFSAPLFAQRTAIFPRLASGAGWTSVFFFTNQGISDVEGIVVSFYNENGVSLSIESNLGTDSSFTFDLDAGATQVLRVTSETTFKQGYVLVDYPSFNDPVRASQVFRYEENGVVTTEVGFPQQEQGDHFTFPVEINPDPAQHIYPAIALSNPMNIDQTLVVNLMNPDGSIRSTKTVTMLAGRHRAGYLDQDWLFPGLNNTTFVGSVSVSSPFGIGVLTLRQDKLAFGGIATDGGPILAPFKVTTPLATDTEPNDYFEEAQTLTLPVRVNGSIGYVDDWDFYYFSGNAGQILTVICDTTQLTSDLDSLVRIFDSDQNEIAYNDQNGLAPGLYPQNDSFIQVVLPHTGGYYVVVRDYWGGVGDDTNYDYNLQLKLR